MQIDRRITNGLAWAGALLVVGIPVADFALRELSNPAPQVSVVQEEPVAPAAGPTAETDAPTPAPTQVASTGSAATGGTAVDSFLQSGRRLPSYISDAGDDGAPAQPALTQPTPPSTPTQAATRPAIETPSTEPVQTAARPPITATTQRPDTPASDTGLPSRTRIVTLPTPVSQRPPSVAQAPAVAQPAPLQTAAPRPSQPPLVVEREEGIVTADDLADWESGPLSDFLEQRSGRSTQDRAPQNYDPNGFFLDQGPNSYAPVPPAYVDDGYYPYER